MNDQISVTFFTGIHHDPRLTMGDTVIFGHGGYITGYAPATLDFLYFVITNNSADRFVPDGFQLETPAGAVIWDLDLPANGVQGKEIYPGKSLVVGFLRDLFSARLRGMEQDTNFRFRAICTAGQARFISPEYEISLDYPRIPTQDVELSIYARFFERRNMLFKKEYERLTGSYGSLYNYANLHTFLGMHKSADGWILREWMPAAQELYLTTDAINFGHDEGYRFQRGGDGIWELKLPFEALPHGRYIELHFKSATTHGHTKRVPAFAKWVEQDPRIQEQWCARVWDPPTPYKAKHKALGAKLTFPRIYEAHIGIAQPYEGRTWDSVGTYNMFTENVLPRIKKYGYTAVQLMGVPEHPLYKSFGYQVSSYFAPSSRFGSPDDFKRLVDTAHELGIAVILDITHSHSAPNTEQALAMYDSTPYFFADKDNQWGTRSFNYSLEMSRRFLLSNCRYWLEEYNLDGFRFDAVGNMIYVDNGFGDDFNNVGRCFFNASGRPRIDEAGLLYLSLANKLTHEMGEANITIAEEFSGMPGMTSAPEEGGLGFDYRFAMGVPDFWAKFIKEGRTVGTMWYEMNNHRRYERTISYVASHDQSINSHDAMIWRLIGDDMYEYMSVFKENWNTSRGIALYKLMRLITLSTAGHGYMSFMGDEFGHPEWIDAADYGHRQWHLTEREDIRYGAIGQFDIDSLTDVLQAHIDSFTTDPILRYMDDGGRVFAFERGELLFAFNFNETQTQSGLELWVKPGKYVEILSSDNKKYAGHGNLEGATEHFSMSAGGAFEKVTLYLPPLVALVLKRVN
ncbi:MAG: alpha amylase C-terminal domain-containing protein [Deferribacteraceae bacterium]|jgi:1,4-alpha-glucan branching enzyme|nr:alpha amylase C-terminal domain-containing protein [Deferribacteraceae bacterium]